MFLKSPYTHVLYFFITAKTKVTKQSSNQKNKKYTESKLKRLVIGNGHMNRLTSSDSYCSSIASSEGQLTPPAKVPCTPTVDHYISGNEQQAFYPEASSVFDSPVSSPDRSTLSPCSSDYSHSSTGSYTSSYNQFVPIALPKPIYMSCPTEVTLSDLDNLTDILQLPCDFHLDISRIESFDTTPAQSHLDFDYEAPEIKDIMTSDWGITADAFL